MEFGLLGAVFIAVVALWLTLRLEARHTPAKATAAALFDDVLVAAIIGMVVGRLWAMVAGGTNPVAHPLDVLIVRGGVDTVAASSAALLVFAVLARSDLAATADAAAAAVLLCLAGWHAGCVVRGACLGTPTTLPWAVHGPAGVGRHPVELYAAGLLAMGAVVIVIVERRVLLGVSSALALAMAAGARLVTEPMRLTIGGGLEWWYATGVIVGLVATVLAGRSWFVIRSS
jgi:prolipoprotein diacylglyceryltransferase